MLVMGIGVDEGGTNVGIAIDPVWLAAKPWNLMPSCSDSASHCISIDPLMTMGLLMTTLDSLSYMTVRYEEHSTVAYCGSFTYTFANDVT